MIVFAIVLVSKMKTQSIFPKYGNWKLLYHVCIYQHQAAIYTTVQIVYSFLATFIKNALQLRENFQLIFLSTPI